MVVSRPVLLAKIRNGREKGGGGGGGGEAGTLEKVKLS